MTMNPEDAIKPASSTDSSFDRFLDYVYKPSSSTTSKANASSNTANLGEQTNDNSQSLKKSAVANKTDKMKGIKWAARSFFFNAAFLLALFPSVMKIYETSHWFREGDPSVYDDAKDWFSNPAIPFQSYFDNSKVLMRVYFFIIPYIVSAFCVTIGLCIPSVPAHNVSGPSFQQHRRATGSILRRTLALPDFFVRMGLPSRVSVAEVFGIAVFLTLNILTIAIRVRRSLPRGSRKIEFLVDSDKDESREPIEPYSWQACEVWAKTLGVVSILNLGWYLLMPVGRKSVLLEALHVSWERAIKYHRWVGYYSVAIMVVHSIMYIIIWVHGDGHPNFDPDGGMMKRNMVPWYCSTNECTEDESRMLRINMYGCVTLFLILVMTAFTLPWIRRQKFEWFYYAHHLFLFVLVFVTLHYKGAIVYLLPGIAIYGVDKIMALYSYQKAAPVATRMLSSDVLEISFKNSSRVNYQAGDYVFLNVPSVSFLQWHPFSITSAPSAHGSQVFFHVKNAGTWTKQVIDEATCGNALKVRLDGFYGVNSGVCEQLSAKDGVILVGGGIGVTPMISLGLELANTKCIPVSLMWVVRTIEEFSILSTELANAQRDHKHFSAKAWITLSGSKSKLIEFDDFNSSLQSIKESQSTPSDNAASQFVLDQPGLSGASNAAVMTLSSVFALVAYALAAKLSNTDAQADTIQDFTSLMELSMVSLFVIIWVVAVIVARRALRHVKYQPQNDIKAPIDESIITLRTISQGSSESDLENDQNDTEALRSVVEGNIGCRPNIPEEFSLFADKVASSLGRPVDIAVLACGPPKLVETINTYINVPATACSLFDRKEKQAFFSFIEEDWEW